MVRRKHLLFIFLFWLGKGNLVFEGCEARVGFLRAFFPPFLFNLRKAKHEALNRGRGTRGLPVFLRSLCHRLLDFLSAPRASSYSPPKAKQPSNIQP